MKVSNWKSRFRLWRRSFWAPQGLAAPLKASEVPACGLLAEEALDASLEQAGFSAKARPPSGDIICR